MAEGKPFRRLAYCSITKQNNVPVLVPYIDSDTSDLFSTYGLSTGVDIAAEGYVFAAIFGTIIDVGYSDSKKHFVLTIQHSDDEIVRYSGLYELYVHEGDRVVATQSVGSVHNKLHVEYATSWKKHARWTIKLNRKVWYKQDPMPFVDGLYTGRNTEYNLLDYRVPQSAKSEFSESHAKLIVQLATAVMKYSNTFGIAVNSPIVAQAIVESEWGQSSMTRGTNCYFIRLKDRTYSSIDNCIWHYFNYINKSIFARMKGMRDPEAFVQSLVDCGYYPKGSQYPKKIINTINTWNLTQLDGISTNLSQEIRQGNIFTRNYAAYAKDYNPNHFNEIQDNKR